LITLVLMALSLARLAVWVLFEFLLPFWLTLVSIVAGPGPRRAAARLVRVGQAGREGLRQASQRIREHSQEVAARQYAVRASEPEIVVEEPRVRIEDAEFEEIDEETESDAGEPPRRRN